MRSLAANLYAAWGQRANAAVELVHLATLAPGLVKPETVAQAERDHDRALYFREVAAL